MLSTCHVINKVLICFVVEIAPTCKSKVDVGFVLDSSGSLKAQYGLEKDFLKKVATSFGLGDDSSRAGVVTFSYSAEHSIKLNDHFDVKQFSKAVDNIPLMGYTTRIDKALRLSQKELFTEANGGRPDVAKMLVILTDGSQTQDADAEDPGEIAKEIAKSGIMVLVIGIGTEVDNKELLHMAGNDQSRVFNAISFEELVSADFVTKFKEKSCETGKMHYISLIFKSFLRVHILVSSLS